MILAKIKKFCIGFFAAAYGLTFCGMVVSAAPRLRVHFLSVGYGDAMVLELPDQSLWLVDAGDEGYSENIAEYLSALKRPGEVPLIIEGLIITHPHKNHFGGASGVLGKIPVNRVFINGDPNAEEGYTELLQRIKGNGIPLETLRAGSRIKGLPRSIHLQVLSPADYKGSVNDNSLVIWLTYDRTSFLLAGDIEGKKQAELIKKYPFIKKAGCVKVPHHGGPIDEQFGRFFEKAVFVISTGPNLWGLPRDEDLEKIKGEIIRTDQLGTIVIESDGDRVQFLENWRTGELENSRTGQLANSPTRQLANSLTH